MKQLMRCKGVQEGVKGLPRCVSSVIEDDRSTLLRLDNNDYLLLAHLPLAKHFTIPRYPSPNSLLSFDKQVDHTLRQTIDNGSQPYYNGL